MYHIICPERRVPPPPPIRDLRRVGLKGEKGGTNIDFFRGDLSGKTSKEMMNRLFFVFVCFCLLLSCGLFEELFASTSFFPGHERRAMLTLACAPHATPLWHISFFLSIAVCIFASGEKVPWICMLHQKLYTPTHQWRASTTKEGGGAMTSRRGSTRRKSKIYVSML